MLCFISGNHLLEWEGSWPPWLLFGIASLFKNGVWGCLVGGLSSEKEEE